MKIRAANKFQKSVIKVTNIRIFAKQKSLNIVNTANITYVRTFKKIHR
jgi:Fe-S cluster assembly iron-binding protein IscA